MKYLIVGLGNPGPEYANTRHNIGFMILDEMLGREEKKFESGRYAEFAELKVKGRKLILIKPQTFMNLSGKAVSYWMQKEKIQLENIMVLVDDLALPFGSIRIRKKGSSGGHNGLQNINDTLGSDQYSRLRFGIGSEFSKGAQVDFVLDNFNEQEQEKLAEHIEHSIKAIKSFPLIGIDRTMNQFNN